MAPKQDDPFLSAPFQGIPTRSLTTDTLEYNIYALHPSLSTPSSRYAALAPVQASAESLLQSWTAQSSYIYQRCSPPKFDLPPLPKSFSSSSTATDKFPSLAGALEYGDSIDDEWYTLSLLLALTRQYPKCWLRPTDTSDGEFLLVEAAPYLPRWLTPETAANRVWINQGRLYIIPGKRNETITLPEALQFLSSLSDPAALTRDLKLEKAALERCKGYPEKAKEQLHRAVVRVPRKVVGVLKKKPEAIAAATDAFYIRDPISLKSIKRPPRERLFPPTDYVRVSLRFTKVLYAQLRGQMWEPPREAGFMVPSLANSGAHPAELDIGNKLTAGFEMLLAKENEKLVESEGVKKVVKEVNDLVQSPSFSDSLPTDDEIATWPLDQDSDSWLDVDFTEFEKDLNAASSGGIDPSTTAGFSDPAQTEKMKKLVERFEKFLNDEEAGLDGAEFGSDDDDDDDDEDSDDDDDDAEEDVDERDILDFDEAEFSRLMREMMGIPADFEPESDTTPTKTSATAATAAAAPESDSESEAAEILKIQDQIGAELREAGIIGSSSMSAKGRGKQPARITELDDDEEEEEEEEDIDEKEEVEVDFELVKNMLESFKAQGGLAGPAGTLLAEMGIYLPRDEGERLEEMMGAVKEGALAGGAGGSGDKGKGKEKA